MARAEESSLSTSSGTLSQQTSLMQKQKTESVPEEELFDDSRSRSRNRLEETTSHCYGDADEDILSKSHSRATGASVRRTSTRRESFLSRIRSRQPIGNFTHPLSHIQTTVEELVDFDGDDDPYRPVNWPFKKKAIT